MILSDVLTHCKAKPTGSHVMGVATEQSDRDYLVERPPESWNSNGWEVVQTYDAHLERFAIYSKWDVHLILPLNMDSRRRWLAAESHCKREVPFQKERRIKIFRHYLYGKCLCCGTATAEEAE